MATEHWGTPTGIGQGQRFVFQSTQEQQRPVKQQADARNTVQNGIEGGPREAAREKKQESFFAVGKLCLLTVAVPYPIWFFTRSRYQHQREPCAVDVAIVIWFSVFPGQQRKPGIVAPPDAIVLM
uniref:Uncharacterized protein n=1 Tax=Anopheles merus TaxID=30066 RepID=A0A182UZG4_ANOME